jgi:hypothetical protein
MYNKAWFGIYQILSRAVACRKPSVIGRRLACRFVIEQRPRPGTDTMPSRKKPRNPDINLDTDVTDAANVRLGRPLRWGHGGTGVADALPGRIASFAYLDAFCCEKSRCPGELRAAEQPASRIRERICPFTLPRPDFWRRSGGCGCGQCAHDADAGRCFTKALAFNGGIDRVRKRTTICCNVPAPTTFMPFYEKLKDDPDWSMHMLPCTHIVQMEMPKELTELLLPASG